MFWKYGLDLQLAVTWKKKHGLALRVSPKYISLFSLKQDRSWFFGNPWDMWDLVMYIAE